MKPQKPLLFLSLAVPIFSAPVPPQLQECALYTTCRVSRASADNVGSRISSPRTAFLLTYVDSRKDVAQPILRDSKTPSAQAIELPLPDLHPKPSALSSAESNILAQLVQEDAKRYGMGIRVGEASNYPCHKKYIKIQAAVSYNYVFRRDYTDILVVAIVVLFLLAVVLVESTEKIMEVFQALLGNRHAIRLEEEPSEQYVAQKPHSEFCQSSKMVYMENTGSEKI